MNLEEYEGLDVVVTMTDGEKYIGNIGDYCSPDDNGYESIIIDCDNIPYPLELRADEIENIESA